MRRVTAATVALLLAAAPAIARDAAEGAGEGASAGTDWDQLVRTSDITDGPVYTTNEVHDEGTWGGAG